MIRSKKTPGEKAQAHAATALAMFDGVVSGLNEANRLLDIESNEALEAVDFHAAEVDRHDARHFAAVQAQQKNTRVVEKLTDLVGV